MKRHTPVVTILPLNHCSKHRALKGITEKRKYSAPISESDADEKTTACRLTNVRNYCRANARQHAYNSQADATHVRQVSAFTYNEKKHSFAGEPTSVPELVQCKWFEKWPRT